MLLPVGGLVITGGALADQPGTAPPGEIYTFLKLAKFSGEILLLLQICQAGLASNMGTFSSYHVRDDHLLSGSEYDGKCWSQGGQG